MTPEVPGLNQGCRENKLGTVVGVEGPEGREGRGGEGRKDNGSGRRGGKEGCCVEEGEVLLRQEEGEQRR